MLGLCVAGRLKDTMPSSRIASTLKWWEKFIKRPGFVYPGAEHND